MSSTLVTQSRSASLIASLRVREPGRHRDDLGAQQPHPGDVQRLPPGVDLAHVDDALQAEQRARRWPSRRRAGPAPVSAITRVLPIRLVSSAWPSTLLILCEPVWLRSSRLSRIRAPPACSRQPRRVGQRRRPAGVVALQPVQLGEEVRVAPRLLVGRRSARPARRPAPRARTGPRSGRSGPARPGVPAGCRAPPAGDARRAAWSTSSTGYHGAASTTGGRPPPPAPATAARGSPLVTRPSPTSTASAPQPA